MLRMGYLYIYLPVGPLVHTAMHCAQYTLTIISDLGVTTFVVRSALFIGQKLSKAAYKIVLAEK